MGNFILQNTYQHLFIVEIDTGKGHFFILKKKVKDIGKIN